MNRPPIPFGVSACNRDSRPTGGLEKVVFVTSSKAPTLAVLSQMLALKMHGFSVELICGTEDSESALPPNWEKSIPVTRIDTENAREIVLRHDVERFDQKCKIFSPWKYLVFYPLLEFLMPYTLDRTADLYVGTDISSAVACKLASLYHNVRSAYLIQGIEIGEQWNKQDRAALERFQLDLIEGVDLVITSHEKLSEYYTIQAAIAYPASLLSPQTSIFGGTGFDRWAKTVACEYQRPFSPRSEATSITVCIKALEQAVKFGNDEQVNSGFRLLQEHCRSENL